jgi:hypothetical protein
VSGCGASAGIQLPNGATPESLKCGVFHGTGQVNNSAAARLWAVGLDFSQSIILETETSQPIGRQVVETVRSESHTVDNASFVYHVDVLFEDPSAATELTLVGCTVQ